MRATANKLSTLGYAYIENFLQDKEVDYLIKSMQEAKELKRLRDETDNLFYNKSEGGSTAELKTVLQDKTAQIKELFNLSNIVPESVYARYYYNESTLNPHFDRKGLDYTLSVSLFSNLNEPWPLYCIDKKCNVESFDIKIGDGAIIHGTKMIHWRKPLICNPGQYIIQAFFHWKAV